MEVETRYIKFHAEVDEIKDITRLVQEQISGTGMESGTVTVFVPGSTGAISTLEYEPGLVNRDIPEFLEKLAPRNKDYEHHKTWGDHNGHSHVRAFALKPDITVPFVNGKMTLGTWQQIVFLNLDERSRTRQLVIQIMGK
ncbi:MAG: secondary thiamine-phosphate synthase enzyme YjbQ [Promethearchaeota archaeon]